MQNPPSPESIPQASPSLLEDWIRRFPKGSIWQTRYICLPFALISATWAFTTPRFDDVTWPLKITLFVLGAFAWTFLEYVIHRWAFHASPKGPLTQALLERLHIYHHADPKDQSQVCIPPSLVIPAALLLLAAFTTALKLPLGHSVFFLSGLFLMLVLYDIAHFSTHYMPATHRVLQILKKQHMLHHFSNHQARFGVTSPFWDHVFRTHR
jgi:sterol desaturase/sphingolipid hydroxylase (fatty acid hydroxylase superfamily)